MKKIKEIIKERKFKYICFFWSIISIQFILGSNLQNKGYLFNGTIDVLIGILKFIMLTIIFIALHYCILELYIKISKSIKEKEKNEQCKEKIKNKKYRWGIYFLIIFLCWIPTVLAFYPAIVGYDGGFQIRDYVFLKIARHHPILITKIYSTFYVIGLMIKSPTFGMFLFSIFQMIFMALVFSYTVKFIEEQTNKKWLRNISILFYGLYPYNQLFSITTTKDVIFAGLVLIFVIYLYKMVKEKYKISDYIFLIIIGVLMLLSRNNSIYTLEVSLPFLVAILMKDKWNAIKIAVTFILVIIIYQSTNNYLYKSMENESVSSTNDEGSFRVSVFSQAVGKVVKDRENELTEEEKEKISYYFKDYKELGQKYQINIADSTVKMANNTNINENKKEFFKFIIELGIKYPITYIESFLNTTRGYWYIEDISFSQILMYSHPGAFELYDYSIANGKYKVVHDSKIPALKNLYINMFCLNEYQKIPVLYTLFQPSIYFYFTLAFLLYAIYKKDKSTLVVAIFLFTFYASCFLALCSIIRYMYPIMVSTPLMLSLVIKNKDEVKNEE